MHPFYPKALTSREFSKGTLAVLFIIMLIPAAIPSGPYASIGYIRSVDFYNLGNAYVLSGQQEEAVKAFKKALAIDPQHRQALHNFHFYTGVVHVKQRQYAPAAEAFKDALKAVPGAPTAQQNYYYFLGIDHKDNKRYEQACESFRQVLNLRPDLNIARKNLAYCQNKLLRSHDTQ